MSVRSQPKAPRRPWQPELLSGFWFLTSAVSLAGVVLAGVVLAVDKHFGNAGAIPGLVVSPDSARTILGSIAGSLITIASLTSSLTIVTLQLLSSQYTPRTVRGFLATRRSQLVLGCFIGIFLYCLVLLVAVREPGDENAPFVPSLGIVVSVLLAVLGLVALVLFLHTMSQTIQVSTMAAGVAGETASAMTRVHDDGSAPGPVDPTPGAAVRADRAGYVRYVDAGPLLAARGGARVQVVARPGDFVTPVTTLALVDGGEDGGGRVPPGLVSAIRRAVEVERERDTRDDPLYGIRQLTDIALRALSPGINDPSTAITCLGYLRGLIEDAAGRPLPRVVAAGPGLTLARPGFEDYLLPLTEIAAYAGSDARVVTALLEALASVAACCGDPARAATVRAITAEILSAALADLRLPAERARLVARLDGPSPTAVPQTLASGPVDEARQTG